MPDTILTGAQHAEYKSLEPDEPYFSLPSNRSEMVAVAEKGIGKIQIFPIPGLGARTDEATMAKSAPEH